MGSSQARHTGEEKKPAAGPVNAVLARLCGKGSRIGVEPQKGTSSLIEPEPEKEPTPKASSSVPLFVGESTSKPASLVKACEPSTASQSLGPAEHQARSSKVIPAVQSVRSNEVKPAAHQARTKDVKHVGFQTRSKEDNPAVQRMRSKEEKVQSVPVQSGGGLTVAKRNFKLPPDLLEIDEELDREEREAADKERAEAAAKKQQPASAGRAPPGRGPAPWDGKSHRNGPIPQERRKQPVQQHNLHETRQAGGKPRIPVHVHWDADDIHYSHTPIAPSRNTQVDGMASQSVRQAGRPRLGAGPPPPMVDVGNLPQRMQQARQGLSKCAGNAPSRRQPPLPSCPIDLPAPPPTNQPCQPHSPTEDPQFLRTSRSSSYSRTNETPW